MAAGTLFAGNALQPVDASGRTRLPPFIVKALARRSSSPRLLFGAHETDPCIHGYDEAFQADLLEDLERRRRREEEQGLAPEAHHGRARRTFGATEVGTVDESGRITLPPMSRRRGQIADRALFIGTGASFEVWNPEVAREAADEALREIAELAAATRIEADEVEQ